MICLVILVPPTVKARKYMFDINSLSNSLSSCLNKIYIFSYNNFSERSQINTIYGFLLMLLCIPIISKISLYTILLRMNTQLLSLSIVCLWLDLAIRAIELFIRALSMHSETRSWGLFYGFRDCNCELISSTGTWEQRSRYPLQRSLLAKYLLFICFI